MLARRTFFCLYALCLCLVTRNHSVSRVDGRGGKRPLVLHPGSEATDGLPGVRVPGRDRPRPQRRRSPSGVDEISRGEEVGVAVPMPCRSAAAVVPLYCRHVPVPDQYIGITAGTGILPHPLPHWLTLSDTYLVCLTISPALYGTPALFNRHYIGHRHCIGHRHYFGNRHYLTCTTSGAGIILGTGIISGTGII